MSSWRSTIFALVLVLATPIVIAEMLGIEKVELELSYSFVATSTCALVGTYFMIWRIALVVFLRDYLINAPVLPYERHEMNKALGKGQVGPDDPSYHAIRAYVSEVLDFHRQNGGVLKKMKNMPGTQDCQLHKMTVDEHGKPNKIFINLKLERVKATALHLALSDIIRLYRHKVHLAQVSTKSGVMALVAYTVHPHEEAMTDFVQVDLTDDQITTIKGVKLPSNGQLFTSMSGAQLALQSWLIPLTTYHGKPTTPLPVYPCLESFFGKYLPRLSNLIWLVFFFLDSRVPVLLLDADELQALQTEYTKTD